MGLPVILCNKESCRHADSHCRAYVYQQWLNDPKAGEWAINCDFFKILAYEDQLYMLTKKDNVECYLCRYDRDYTNEERIACLSQAEADPRVLVVEESASLIYHDSFYYLTFEIDDETAFKQGCDTTFALWRVKLKKGASPEKLYSFRFPADYNGFWTMGGGSAFRILQSGGDIYCIAAVQYRDAPERNQTEQRVIRYNDSDGPTLLWEYSGNEKVNFMGAEGEDPAFASDSLMDDAHVLYYICEERQPHTGGKTIRSVNLNTGESKEIYRNPDSVLSEFSTDGAHFYFFEGLKSSLWRKFLTAIDRQGTVIRRYAFEYIDEKESAVRKAEETGTEPELQSLNQSDLKFLVTDSRFLVIGAYDYNDYKDFQLRQGADPKWLSAGIGLILTEDFLDGKDVEIQQIYE